jgi:2-dehydropantoate 2-reductase
MRILVMGSGGIGGFFGGHYAKAGHEVTFVARGAHLAALRANGLTVESPSFPLRLERVSATDDPATAGSPDIVMFCVKLWDVESAAQQIAPQLGKDTLVIPFQNGVVSHRILQRVLGAERVAGGVAHIPSTIKAPGVIAHGGGFARLRVGMFDQRRDPRLDAFAQAGKDAGIDVEVVENIDRTLWEKFVFLSAFSGVTAASRQTVGPVRSDPHLRAALEAAMRETLALAQAYGAGVDAGYVDRQMQFVDTMPPTTPSSQLNDLIAGNRLEAPWLSGGVAQMSRDKGLAAPVHATLYAVLRPYVNGASAAARP